jgi:rhomboid protease GluP
VKLRITYNAPVVLTFALLAVIVQLLPDSVKEEWFVAQPNLEHSVHGYLRLVSYVLGHANWQHLLGNFMLILLIGPILEERHGSLRLLGMIIVTALVTGVVYMVFSSGALLGASGVAFMMILLASMANVRGGEIPLTFIAVAVIYLGGEIVKEFTKHDNVSHMAHLIGGAVGAVFGFLGAPRKAKATGGVKPALGVATAKPLDKVVGE